MIKYNQEEYVEEERGCPLFLISRVPPTYASMGLRLYYLLHPADDSALQHHLDAVRMGG